MGSGRKLRLLTFVFFAVGLLLNQASAAPPKGKRGYTVTDIAKAGDDFRIQGEYLGFVTMQRVRKRVGLQVIAQGGGSFKGVVHSGGLPGAGWDGEDKGRLTGKLTGTTATLRGNDQTWTIATSGSVQVEGPGGTAIGQLSRVKRVSDSMGARPPQGATILFDGSTTEHFQRGRMTSDKLLRAGSITKMKVQDFQLHLEFRTPYMPNAREQGRGNSGVYIQKRYEVQILDSFGLEGVHNECGGLYRQRRPDLNMCFPPLSWQTYDIDFRAARWVEGKKVANARLTVRHNGVLIHDDVEVPKKTGAGDQEAPQGGPIRLQFHGNPVHYRNIWIVEKKDDDSQADGCNKRRCRLRALLQRWRNRRKCDS